MKKVVDGPGGDRKVGLVLAGGGARAAYEVGVLSYLFGEVAREVGRAPRLSVISGTSAGAVNGIVMAVFADQPAAGAVLLSQKWASLTLDQILRPDRREIFAMIRALLGRPVRLDPTAARRGGILDSRPLEALLESVVDRERLARNLAAGLVSAVSVTTTHVGSGRTVVFVQRSTRDLPPWGRHVLVRPRAAVLTAQHALASAAIPLLFPAVKIDGEFYCDGSLRQNVPLSPARRLGAEVLLVVNPRHAPLESRRPGGVAGREQAFPGPAFLLGKTLNALILDRIDNDLDRLRRVNDILEAGTRAFGPGFTTELNRQLQAAGAQPVRQVGSVHARASRDIGRMAAELARSRRFRARMRGLRGRVVLKLADGDARNEADLLSYLLFDGEFLRDLMALGRADARVRHGELCALFAPHADRRAA